MSRRLRHHGPGAVVEITTRTLQGRHLLRPSRKLVAIILGILGRALLRYGVRLHAFVFVSNHYHLIVSIDDVRELSRFMAYLNGNLAREAGRLHGWRDRFWSRRFASIEVLDDDAQVERLQYLLSHGCKEGLVADPRQWPGATCVHALAEGEPLVGTWYDRTAEWFARRKDADVDEEQFAEPVTVALEPLPCWKELEEEERRARVRAMLEHIVAQTAERNRAEGRRPLGVRKVLLQDPHHRPDSPKKSPAPRCHTSDRDRWIEFVQTWRAFEDWYRQASAEWLTGKFDAVFPPDCFRPPMSSLPVGEIALVPS